jgi:hypothetical protein
MLITSLLVTLLQATTVTYRMKPHEKACFYTEVQTAGEKLAFYFSVQEGGNFDVDYEVSDPHGTKLHSGMSEKQLDIVFSAAMLGEYSFCFSNTMSTFVEKLVDFDISVEHELQSNSYFKSELEKSVGKTKGSKSTETDEAIQKLKVFAQNNMFSAVSNIQRQQRLIKTNEHRNNSVVATTESRIVWFAIFESICMGAMGAVQIYIIKNFFSKSVRTRV